MNTTMPVDEQGKGAASEEVGGDREEGELTEDEAFPDEQHNIQSSTEQSVVKYQPRADRNKEKRPLDDRGSSHPSAKNKRRRTKRKGGRSKRASSFRRAQMHRVLQTVAPNVRATPSRAAVFDHWLRSNRLLTPQHSEVLRLWRLTDRLPPMHPWRSTWGHGDVFYEPIAVIRWYARCVRWWLDLSSARSFTLPPLPPARLLQNSAATQITLPPATDILCKHVLDALEALPHPTQLGSIPRTINLADSGYGIEWPDADFTPIEQPPSAEDEVSNGQSHWAAGLSPAQICQRAYGRGTVPSHVIQSTSFDSVQLDLSPGPDLRDVQAELSEAEFYQLRARARANEGLCAVSEDEDDEDDEEAVTMTARGIPSRHRDAFEQDGHGGGGVSAAEYEAIEAALNALDDFDPMPEGPIDGAFNGEGEMLDEVAGPGDDPSDDDGGNDDESDGDPEEGTGRHHWEWDAEAVYVDAYVSGTKRWETVKRGLDLEDVKSPEGKKQR